MLLGVIPSLVCITLHELSHGLVAWSLGDMTARNAGRLTLNPLKHIDWMGLLMMVVLHVGWAKPVPVNMYRFKNPKTGMALTAAAGPVSNLLLALVSGFAYWISLALVIRSVLAGSLAADPRWIYLAQFFQVSLILNAGLAVFNLIPISPLDGSKILALVLPERAYRQLMRYEQYGMFLLMVLLFTGVLDKPLDLLRGGVMSGIEALAKPLAEAIAGASL
jgi:Zn-dependent protease